MVAWYIFYHFYTISPLLKRVSCRQYGVASWISIQLDHLCLLICVTFTVTSDTSVSACHTRFTPVCLLSSLLLVATSFHIFCNSCILITSPVSMWGEGAVHISLVYLLLVELWSYGHTTTFIMFQRAAFMLRFPLVTATIATKVGTTCALGNVSLHCWRWR